MRKYFSWKIEGKAFPKTFTEDRINRLNELGFEWRLKDANTLLDNEDPKQDAALIDNVTRRELHDTGKDVPIPRPIHERQMAVQEEVGRFEPYRTNVSIYEQRGWM
jgi:hypothetical protein